MKFGYCRVSTKEQSFNRQIDSLTEYGIHKANIYKEKITGTKKDRPQLNKLLEDVEQGDIVVVSELARLGRSTKDLIQIAETLAEKGVELVSLKESLDTTTATGKAMFGMLSVMAQFERDLISERTKEGLESARARGKLGGRPKKRRENVERALMLYDMKTIAINDICEMCNMSKPTLYKYVNERKLDEKSEKGD